MPELAQTKVLVLGGGGILGEAWMSAVLTGLSEASGFDACACDAYVGTSAGSIVAAALAAGVEPGARLGELPEQPAVESERAVTGDGLATRLAGLGRAAAAPMAAVGLRSTAAAGALLRRAALARVPAGRRSLDGLGAGLDRLGARWDGRLLVVAVDVQSGRRVVFGAPGAPQPPVGRAVAASCAIPGVFRPVTIDGRPHVDGGAWSPTNMDVAPVSRDDRRALPQPDRVDAQRARCRLRRAVAVDRRRRGAGARAPRREGRDGLPRPGLACGDRAQPHGRGTAR